MASDRIKLFSRYLVAGGTAAACHFAILIFLIEAFAINSTLSSVAGFIVAIFVNYSLQYHWTFSIKENGNHKVIFSRYLVVTLSTLCLNAALFWILNEVLFIHYIVSQVIVSVFVLIVNFTINQCYTFKTTNYSCSNESYSQ